jgi:hypothetical protein
VILHFDADSAEISAAYPAIGTDAPSADLGTPDIIRSEVRAILERIVVLKPR